MPISAVNSNATAGNDGSPLFARERQRAEHKLRLTAHKKPLHRLEQTSAVISALSRDAKEMIVPNDLDCLSLVDAQPSRAS